MTEVVLEKLWRREKNIIFKRKVQFWFWWLTPLALGSLVSFYLELLILYMWLFSWGSSPRYLPDPVLAGGAVFWPDTSGSSDCLGSGQRFVPHAENKDPPADGSLSPCFVGSEEKPSLTFSWKVWKGLERSPCRLTFFTSQMDGGGGVWHFRSKGGVGNQSSTFRTVHREKTGIVQMETRQSESTRNLEVYI